MKDIKVSVIMPSLNVCRYIRECADSVINQTLKDIEIIFVDAGSTDGTLEILEKYVAEDSRIVLLHSDRKSYGYQMNLGIKRARGEYIGIVETDDFVDQKMFEELYRYASETNADIVKGPYIEYFNEKYSTTCYYADMLNEILPEGCFSCKEYGHLLAYHASVWSGIYKRKYLVDNHILFVEAPGAGYVDVGFRYDTCVNTEKCAWYPKPLYFYRTSNNGSSTNNFRLSVMLERWHELHVKSQSIKEDFDRYYAPYLVFDEYLNTVAYLKVLNVSEEELNLLKDNVSFLNEEILLNSPVMNRKEKKDFLLFLKDPDKYTKKYRPFLSLTGSFRKTMLRLFPKGSKRRVVLKRIHLFLRERTENG